MTVRCGRFESGSTPGPASATSPWACTVKASTCNLPSTTSAAGARLLHDRDGAFGDERDRHRMGAHALARDAAGGVGGATTGQPRELGRMPSALDQQNGLSA